MQWPDENFKTIAIKQMQMSFFRQPKYLLITENERCLALLLLRRRRCWYYQRGCCNDIPKVTCKAVLASYDCGQVVKNKLKVETSVCLDTYFATFPIIQLKSETKVTIYKNKRSKETFKTVYPFHNRQEIQKISHVTPNRWPLTNVRNSVFN